MYFCPFGSKNKGTATLKVCSNGSKPKWTRYKIWPLKRSFCGNSPVPKVTSGNIQSLRSQGWKIPLCTESNEVADNLFYTVFLEDMRPTASKHELSRSSLQKLTRSLEKKFNRFTRKFQFSSVLASHQRSSEEGCCRGPILYAPQQWHEMYVRRFIETFWTKPPVQCFEEQS